jgi:hypothetical protein
MRTHLLLTHSHKYGILADAFDATPRDTEIFGLSKGKQPVSLRYQQRQYASVGCIKFNIRSASQPSAAAQIDNFLFRQFDGIDSLHILPPFIKL